ncbi:hypothetical protein M427DRAFT_340454 [Gonapodya prolifera JEL478]|uniref:Uncharacterized protein n=1 Tax=Gonapodya prolifera (strain JEL478) TaxID=1344416 RepID=A0A139ADZ2_GONPJ|nr:hypothetical protein M427DRAFT_340454 [Gonapodya prolifera JEL478]|eukprot:KXS14633.1 hypothetical protein M427DRAFT_340454 [Gonapodya prolifera JEL478]
MPADSSTPSATPQPPPVGRWMALLRWLNLDAILLPILGFLIGSLFTDLSVDAPLWRQPHSFILRDFAVQRAGTIYYYTKVTSAPVWFQSITQVAFLIVVGLLLLDFWRREIRTYAEMIALGELHSPEWIYREASNKLSKFFPASMFVAYRSWNENIAPSVAVLADPSIYEAALVEDESKSVVITDALFSFSVGNFAVVASLGVVLVVRAYEYMGGTLFQTWAKQAEVRRLQQKREQQMGARELGNRIVGVETETLGEDGKVTKKKN